MESRDSEITRRFPRRKALVDVSNRVFSSSISAYSRKPKPQSVAVPDDGGASSIGSCPSSKVEPPRSDPKLADPSANSGVRGGSVLETVIPCTRRRAKKLKEKQKTKQKTTMEASHFSCPPAKRVKISGENQIKTAAEDGDRKGSSSVPHSKPKRTWKYMLSSDDEGQPQTMLPRQFIEEQRAYFAEVDAFQLAEEVISEDDLE